MKCLLFILAIWLLLISFPDSVKPNDEVIKLCGRQFVEKLAQLCRNLEDRIHHPYDSFQVSDDHDYFKEPNMKVQRINDSDEIEKPESCYGKQLFDDDQEYDDFNEYKSGTEKNTKMQPALPKRLIHPKLRKRQLDMTCCKVGCSMSEMLQRCKL